MKFRTKPAVIEAIQFTGPGSFGDMCASWGEPFLEACSMDSRGVVQIKTLEGILLPSERDWIIKGIQGKFYPCKPDIFAKKYELEVTQLDGDRLATTIKEELLKVRKT